MERRTRAGVPGCKTRERSVQFTNDRLQRLQRVDIDHGTSLRLVRDSIGQITGEMWGGDVSRRIRYGADGRMNAQAIQAGGRTLVGQTYRYDQAGNLLERNDSVFGTDRYEYGSTGALMAHETAPGDRRNYPLDPAGDRLVTTVAGGQREAWTRSGSFNGAAYHFDPAGNLVERAGPDNLLRFTWDCRGRLVESIDEAGRSTRYHYDAVGRRISKQSDNSVTYFFWSGDVLVGEAKCRLSSDGSPRAAHFREWVHHPGTFKPLLVVEANVENAADPPGDNVYMFHSDPNGCPTRLLDVDGKIVWAAQHDAWGRARISAGSKTDNPIRLQGQYADEETGLFYTRHRYYDPSVGQFILRSHRSGGRKQSVPVRSEHLG